MPRQIDRQHGVPMPGEPARRQLPHRVVAARPMHEHDRRLGRIERPPARRRIAPSARRPSAPWSSPLLRGGERLGQVVGEVAASSRPIDRRTSSSPTPALARSSTLICWCVVLAGWITSDLASPTLARCENTLSRSISLAPALRPPLMPKLRMAPAPFGICRLASAWSGWLSRPGYFTQATAACFSRKPRDGLAVGDVARHAHGQRLDALQQIEGIGGAHAGAEVAQALGARAHDEGAGAELLGEGDAVIAGVGLGHGRELARRGRPVEAAAVDDDAADGDAVAAQELGGGMHDDVGAVLDGAAQIGRGEGGVDRQRQRRACGRRRPPPRCPAPRGPGLPSVSANSSRVLSVMARAKLGGVARVDQRGGDAEARQGMHEHVVRAAVDARGSDDVPARAHQRGDRRDAAPPGRWRWRPRRRRPPAPRCAPPAPPPSGWRCASRCAPRAPG